jgi:hypothetical protein
VTHAAAETPDGDTISAFDKFGFMPRVGLSVPATRDMAAMILGQQIAMPRDQALAAKMRPPRQVMSTQALSSNSHINSEHKMWRAGSWLTYFEPPASGRS